MALKTALELKGLINLVDYALVTGYKIDKSKSTNTWVKLKNEFGDSIVIDTRKQTYFNSGNDADKGDILQFKANRLKSDVVMVDKSREAFYESLKILNETVGNYEDIKNNPLVKDKDKYLQKKETLVAIQNKEWNHVPIENNKFLTEERAIDLKTILHESFKDRIFNTYFRLNNSHLITNTAFGKYKNGELVGLEVRNKGLKNIVGDDAALFLSKVEENKKINYIFYGESAIDALSYFEILSNNPNFNTNNNDYCFISFGGNLYDAKLENFKSELDLLNVDRNTKFISITDNDLDKVESKKEGKKYDVMITDTLLKKFYPGTEIKLDNSQYYELIVKDEFLKSKLEIHGPEIISNQNESIENNFSSEERFGKYTMIKKEEDQIKILFSKDLPLTSNKNEEIKINNGFKDIINLVNPNLFIPHKSKGKDWNDDLQNIKKKINEIQEESYTKQKNIIDPKIEKQEETSKNYNHGTKI